jgi:hypothetical protein
MGVTDVVNVLVISGLGGLVATVVCKWKRHRRCKRVAERASLGLGYEIGDPVYKKGGDYTFEGEVRAVLIKRSGERRYVVEDDRGVLHIYSDGNLRAR